MLATAFPPLPYWPTPAFDEMFEAIALCNLAGYPAGSMTTRSTDSFKRAWGMDSITSFAANGNGTPGFKAALWEHNVPSLGISRKLVIAIDGISSLFDGGVFETLPSTYYTFTGRVKTRWKTFADTIEAALANQFGLGDSDQRIRTQLTFTGWSAGAAVAELLACRYNAQYHFPAVKCFKFGSPQVGNHSWYANRSARIQRQNLLCGGDPICSVPGGGSNLSLFTSQWESSCNLQLDPDVLVFNHRGENQGGYRSFHRRYPGDVFAEWLTTSYAEYPWSDHNRRWYFTTCADFCYGLYPSLFWRISQSEMPDADLFHERFVTGVRALAVGDLDENTHQISTQGLFETGSLAGAAYDTPIELRRELGQIPAPRPIVTQAVRRADPELGSSAPDVWGDPTPITELSSPVIRRRLHVRRFTQ